MSDINRWWRGGILFAAVLVNAWGWRLVQLADRTLSLSAADLQGMAMDMAVAIAVTALLLCLLPLSRLAGLALAAGWAVVNVAGYEYTRVFDAPLTLTYAHYLADPTFVSGSGTHVSRPWLLGGLFAWVVIASWYAPRLVLRRRLKVLAMSMVLLVSAGLAGTSLGAQEWRRQHLLLANASALVNGRATSSSAGPAEEVALPGFLAANLEGTPRLVLPGAGENVLLVILEGVSGAFLSSFTQASDWQSDIVMPHLDAIGRQGIAYRHFLTQQRQTNRGTYSLLCGDLPKLDSSMPRMSDIANRGEPVSCLPRLLSDAGYHTAYWQAAPLAFMRKDTFMELAGFREVAGEADLSEANRRTSWGVDDKAFMEASLARLRTLQDEQTPWFMTLMTAGTHHPYNVPEGSELAGDERQQAFGYLDAAIRDFVTALDAHGLRDDTLVLITTDESSGLGAVSDDRVRQLSQNWGMMIALLPEDDVTHAPSVVEAPHAQYDVALSILDYLGLKTEGTPLLGRSLFRDYGTSRPLAMGNTYAKQQYLLEDKRLMACQEGLEACRDLRHDGEGPIAFTPFSETGSEGVRDQLEHAVAYSQRPLEGDQRHERWQLMPTGSVALEAREGNQVLFGGQSWDFAAGTRLSVELAFSVEQGQEVTLMHSLLDDERGFHHADIPVLSEGDEHVVDYEVTFERDVQGVNANLTVEQPGTESARLNVKQATVVVRQSGSAPQ
ncbi:MAG: LTA synthase family protein [Pseudomonadota bacterium]